MANGDFLKYEQQAGDDFVLVENSEINFAIESKLANQIRQMGGIQQFVKLEGRTGQFRLLANGVIEHQFVFQNGNKEQIATAILKPKTADKDKNWILKFPVNQSYKQIYAKRIEQSTKSTA